MNQAPAKKSQTPVYYDADYVNDIFERSGKTQEAVAYESGHSATTVALVRQGKATTFPPVYNVIRVCGGSYEQAFIGLSKFQNHRAVVPDGKSGGSAVSGRSVRGDGTGRSKHR